MFGEFATTYVRAISNSILTVKKHKIYEKNKIKKQAAVNSEYFYCT